MTDPLMATLDKAEEVLGHSPHPALVAIPIGAWVASNIFDVLALATGDDRYDDAAKLTIGVGLLGAVGAAVTGLHDYGRHVKSGTDSHEIATRHGIGNAIAGALFVTSYVLRTNGRRPTPAARLLSLAGGALVGYTGYLGGVLVEEHGIGVHPVEKADPAPHGRARLDPAAPLGV